MAKIFIMDYQNKKTEIEVNLDRVVLMEITVKTGDEILDILYDDGSREQYDSSSDRRRDYYDGEYEVINKLSGHDEFDRWIKRTDVYDYLYS